MYTLELTLKGNPAPLVLQQKEESQAQDLYHKIRNALETGTPRLLDLTCDRTGKTMAVLTQDMIAVQLTPKAGSGAVAVRPGFLAQMDPPAGSKPEA
jgi:hypothetical protein